MNVEKLKAGVCAAVDRHKEKIIAIGEQVWRNPELGFQEYATAALVADVFRGLDLPMRTGLAITGVRADLVGGTPGPTVALLGEMDALILPDHPAADCRTGAAHACGHHAQVAALCGAALALKTSGVMARLAGRVVFMAVPAEEYIQIALRREWAQNGKIEFLGGKAELIRLGVFDDVNLAMLIHAMPGDGAAVRRSTNGFVAKNVRFIGRAAHAAGQPQHGVNALKAATLALNAVDAQRDTFKDDDHVRVHAILTKGGDVVNIVPDNVALEAQVRAASLPAIADTAQKFDRAMRAGALALGAEVEIETLPGYLPLADNPMLAELFLQNAGLLLPAEKLRRLGHLTSSTDMGDVSQIMPAAHPSLGGTVGRLHGADFQVVNPELAYVVAAKILAMTAVDLLADDGRQARDIMAKFPPALSIGNYCALLRQQARCEKFAACAVF